MLVLADLVDHVLQYAGKDMNRDTCRAALGAARQACSQLAQKWNWNWFRTTVTIPLDDIYQTGTVQYVASTRTLTLTGGTWPSWAVYGAVKLNDIDYEVATRTSGTVLVLKSTSAPDEDISTDTTYLIRRYAYQLPENFDSIHSAVTQPDGLIICYRDMDESNAIWQQYYGAQSYTVAADRLAPGRSIIQISPTVTTTNSIQVSYKRKLSLLRYDNFSTPDESRVAVASATVTGDMTVFKSDMVGQVFRASADDMDYPTGEFGNNLYAHESIISAVGGSTSLTLETAITDALTRSKYVVSSLIDARPGPMVEYLFRETEKQFRAKTRMQPYNREELDNYEAAFTEARENDKPYTGLTVVEYPYTGRFLTTSTDVPLAE